MGARVGVAAKEMLGKTPIGIDAIRPLRNGVIADFEITEKMLRYFITKVHDGRTWATPRSGDRDPERHHRRRARAVINSAERAGARRVFLIEEPLAAGIGCRLPVTAPRGSMIVDIGGGTTEVAILSLAGMVSWASPESPATRWIPRSSNIAAECTSLNVGEQWAEKIKIKIGSAAPLEQEMAMDVRGNDVLTGMPRQIELTSEEVREALLGPVRQIVAAIRKSAIGGQARDLGRPLRDGDHARGRRRASCAGSIARSSRRPKCRRASPRIRSRPSRAGRSSSSRIWMSSPKCSPPATAIRSAAHLRSMD